MSFGEALLTTACKERSVDENLPEPPPEPAAKAPLLCPLQDQLTTSISFVCLHFGIHPRAVQLRKIRVSPLPWLISLLLFLIYQNLESVEFKASALKPRSPKITPERTSAVRHQPKRNGQFIQLEVRPQERDGPVGTRLARNLTDFDPRFAKRELRPYCGAWPESSSGTTYCMIHCVRNVSHCPASS